MTPKLHPHVLIASDHAGPELKKTIIEELTDWEWEDLGPGVGVARVDYPDYARSVCEGIQSGRAALGVLICGSGVGMTIAANKFNGIRAALAFNVESARLARDHNNANVLCLGSRVTDRATAVAAVRAFLTTEFSQDERHHARVQKLTQIERAQNSAK